MAFASRRVTAALTLGLLLSAVTACVASDAGDTASSDSEVVEDTHPDGVFRTRLRFKHGDSTGYALVEILDDDLAHVEYGVGPGPSVANDLYASPLVGKRDYTGPKHAKQSGHRIDTDAMRIEMDDAGCITFTDTATKGRERFLTSTCPQSLFDAWKGIDLDPKAMQNVYGLGQNFLDRGSADGDWTKHGKFATNGSFGNNFNAFWGGANGQIQFPVMYAVGQDNDDFALLYDNVYKQEWSFTGAPWTVRAFGDQVRFYVMTGPDLADLRSDYMELTGRPPVPPRKAFGMWLSQFGFRDWSEADAKVSQLRDAKFPIDGLVLDLQWFGGTDPNQDDSAMGGLAWGGKDDGHDGDRKVFKDPGGRIAAYAKDHLGIITIEESYVSRGQPDFATMQGKSGFATHCGGDAPIEFWNWMGHTSMIDWSNRDAAALWHDTVRKPNVIAKGVMGHWTDLGEPERYDGDACYKGVEQDKTHHSDIHNIYNLLWHESIYEGYVRNHCQNGGDGCTNQRPFLLSRAGAPGIQRFGAGMWSGDVASRLDVLATHENVAMHMSFAGIDYYGADVGGFWRPALHGQDPDLNQVMEPDTAVSNGWKPWEPEMFMQWFANAAWFDVPLRPHVFNCGFDWFTGAGCKSGAYYESSPAKMVGNATHLDSNRENLRQRYELIPYYYSLAHQAYDTGAPVIAPVVLYYQNDPAVRQMGHERLVGRDVLVGVVASHGQNTRTMYLPKDADAGNVWIDYHTGDRRNGGTTTEERSLYSQRDGQNVFQLPVFVRAGAILPAMKVDDLTLDSAGNRSDGTVADDLVVKVFADPSRKASSFRLVEDDGATVTKYVGKDPRFARPTYDRRTTQLGQTFDGATLKVTIAAAQGTFAGARPERDNEVRVVAQTTKPAKVLLDGNELPKADGAVATPGTWTVDANGTLVVRTGPKAVSAAKAIEVRYQ